MHRFLTAGRPWEDVALVPLVDLRASVLGELVVLPGGGAELNDEDLGYLTALADQAAVAVRNGTLFRAAEQSATLVERHRLARELHDSVSQALFSMTLHARAAQRHLEASELPDDHPVAGEVAQLHALTQAALAEMRALIFELRPDALAGEGLTLGAEQAGGRRCRPGAARRRRSTAPSRALELPADVEEQPLPARAGGLEQRGEARRAAARRQGVGLGAMTTWS